MVSKGYYFNLVRLKVILEPSQLESFTRNLSFMPTKLSNAFLETTTPLSQIDCPEKTHTTTRYLWNSRK